MDEITTIQILVEQCTARVLTDVRGRAAVGRQINRILRPARGEDPLAALREATARAAPEAGL
jgi:hypothetical protein